MNAKIALSTLVLAAGFAGTAFAESPIAGNAGTFASGHSRDAVQAELVAYKKAGVNPWSTSYNPLRSFRSATTRDAVTADYLAARREVSALTGEDSGSAYLARTRLPGAPVTNIAGNAQ